MNDVPRDMQSIGEIVMRGDNIMDGYYKEPKATAGVMTNGWLHTGDMAVWDEDNYIQIVDRKKDIIISGGENISSHRSGARHLRAPRGAGVRGGLRARSAVGRGSGGFRGAQARPRSSPNRSFAISCKRASPGSKCRASSTSRTPPLPKTGTGKIVKRELRETFWQRQGAAGSRMNAMWQQN